jgi:hypothetical protein
MTECLRDSYIKSVENFKGINKKSDIIIDTKID